MSEPDRPLAGRRILVVEDEYLIADKVRRWLAAAGAEVVGPAPSVERALDLINGLDAAVLDVDLGDGDTVHAVAVRLDGLGVPYLFATGDVRLVDAQVHGDRPRLEKPFREADLLRSLAGLVR